MRSILIVNRSFSPSNPRIIPITHPALFQFQLQEKEEIQLWNAIRLPKSALIDDAQNKETNMTKIWIGDDISAIDNVLLVQRVRDQTHEKCNSEQRERCLRFHSRPYIWEKG